ncbi:phosphotyrosine protein phosphatase [Candidatus Woesearchaeota archaeon]|nr:phosphotyrosine protein phosphatase [Candidatus Woesearchaeota archaeon]
MYRSRTAEDLFKDKHETQSAGIYSYRNQLTKEKLDWADLVIVMEDHQRKFIGENFPKQYLNKKIICLDIKDIYNYDEPKLIKLLKEKIFKEQIKKS